MKRIKVGADTFATGLPNKVRQLKHGILQANLLCQLGFHRTYLLIAIVTDGRERTGLNFASRGPTTEILQTIERFPRREALDQTVGLAFVELTQPIDKDIRYAGSIGIRIAVEAETIKQSPALNEAVERFNQQNRANGDFSFKS